MRIICYSCSIQMGCKIRPSLCLRSHCCQQHPGVSETLLGGTSRIPCLKIEGYFPFDQLPRFGKYRGK